MPTQIAKRSAPSGSCTLVCSLANLPPNCVTARIKPRCRRARSDWRALTRLHSQPRMRHFPATATLVINGTSFLAGAYQIAVQGSSGSTNNSYPVQFNVGDYSISGTQVLSTAPGGQVKVNLAFASLDFYSAQVNATCDATALSGTQRTLTPQNPITIGSAATVPATATINVPNNAIPAAYSINVNKQAVTGAPSHSETVSR